MSLAVCVAVWTLSGIPELKMSMPVLLGMMLFVGRKRRLPWWWRLSGIVGLAGVLWLALALIQRHA